MEIFILRFAAGKGDEPKNYILDGQKYDDWVMAEPQEGYGCFVLLWHGEVGAAFTTLNDLRDICMHLPR